jgi:hypothetical protein
VPIDQRDDAFERLVPAARAARAQAADAPSDERREPLEGGLRPRSTGELLDLVVELLRRRFGTIVGLSVLLILPSRLLQPFIGIHLWFPGVESGEPDVGMMAMGLVGMMLLPAAAQMLARATVVPIAWGELTGERVGAGGAFGRALARFFPLLVLTILIALLTSVGVCALLVGALFVAWKLAAAVPALVVERVGLAQALQRSVELTGGGFLRFLVLGTVMVVTVTPLNSFPGFATDDPTIRPMVIDWLGVSEAAFDVVAVPLTALFLGLGVAIAAIVAAVYYADCRVRRDGEDLRRRVARLELLHPAPEVQQRFTKETW